MSDPIEVRNYVQFEVVGGALRGTGSVRSCERVGNKYALGLEFSGGLRWRA
jgi:hypothetical protein